jgi:hypothetical protein
MAEKPKRQGISKKTRFDVFKRDGFKCQYCGAHPPQVLLHVDHILAVANGGKNNFDNFVTACEPCNLGKGARELTCVPQSLSDKAKQVAEREEQLRGYSEILEFKRQRLDDETWRVLDVMRPGVTNIPHNDYMSVRRFIDRLGFHEVLDSMDTAMGSTASYRNKFKYFCGVCWGKIREENS